MDDESLLEKLRAHVEPLGYPLFALSAASHTGTRELVLKIAEKLSTLPPVTVYEPEYVPKPVKIDASEPLKITVEDNTYIVEGKWLERLMSNVNFGDYESRMFFDKMLRENGVFQQLEDLGIKDGDIVSMYELEFEYQHYNHTGEALITISLCEDCVYYSYDEESDSYYCDEQLDEDEMASFLRGKLTACPFYHPGQSDYYLAGKQ